MTGTGWFALKKHLDRLREQKDDVPATAGVHGNEPSHQLAEESIFQGYALRLRTIRKNNEPATTRSPQRMHMRQRKKRSSNETSSCTLGVLPRAIERKHSSNLKKAHSTYLVGVELADRRLSSHYLEVPLSLREGRRRLLRCEPSRQLEAPSGAPQRVLPVVVVLREGARFGGKGGQN